MTHESLTQTDQFIAPSLTMPKQWETFQLDHERMYQLDELVTATQQLTKDLHGAPAWVHNHNATRLRWQHAIEYTAIAHNSDWQLTDSGNEFLNAFDHAVRSINTYGWEVPGIQFRFHSNETTKSDRGLGRSDLIDLRDMDEPSPILPPLKEFKLLNDEQVAELRKKLDDRLEERKAQRPAPYKETFGEYTFGFGIPGTASGTFKRELIDFGQFNQLRRHGIPDREVSGEDIAIYLKSLVEHSLERDPNFGSVPDTSAFTKVELSHMMGIMTFLEPDWTLDEPPQMDVDQLQEEAEVSRAQALQLVTKGMLSVIHYDRSGKADTFELTRPWEDLWFRARIKPTDG